MVRVIFFGGILTTHFLGWRGITCIFAVRDPELAGPVGLDIRSNNCLKYFNFACFYASDYHCIFRNISVCVVLFTLFEGDEEQ
jgi:hypothetical protein